jgi:Abortive infection alpha
MASSSIAAATAKAGQEPADDVAAGAASFGVWLDEIVRRPFGIPSGHYWGDRIHAKRVEDAIFDRERLKLLAWRTSARLLALDVQDRRLVAPKVGLPLLEAATIEYDDQIHILWSNLLASALDPAAAPVEKRFVTILSELDAEDVGALESLCADGSSPNWAAAEGQDGDAPSIGAAVTDNLGRLGLIALGRGDSATIVVTALGAAFCRAAGISRMPQAGE